MKNTKLLTVVVAGAAMVAGTALAHHTRAHFDRTRSVEVSGTVVEYHLINPHSWLYVDAKGADGKIEKWTVETNGAVNMLVKAGWSKDSIKPGDHVTALVNPVRDGSHGGMLLTIKLADGSVLGDASLRGKQ